MKNRGRRTVLIAVLGMLVMSCMLPGMIPLNNVSEVPRPYFEHIVVKIYFNEEELGNDVMHALTYVSPENNMPCQAYSVLMSECPEGT